MQRILKLKYVYDFLFKVTKSRGSSVTHNSHNRNNGGGHKDSLKNDLAVFTGFKSALEACYLDCE